MKVSRMNRLCMAGLVLISIVLFSHPVLAEMMIPGAGASFPFPVYSKWAVEYAKTTGVKVTYQSIGSGGGIAMIKAKNVAFGGSDAPLKASELEEAGLIQFPMVMGGVVPIVNIKGIKPGEVRMSSRVLTDIFLGEITTWNDPAITNLNPELALPNQDITVVHRADGSGTTNIFTHYLGRVSPEWTAKVGVGKSVDWPVGIGAKGNEGISAYVRKVKGSIGYVEYAYALLNRLAYVSLQNKDGEFVLPTIESFQAAASNADWKNSPGFYMFLTDQPGATSWPITGVTYILMHADQPDAELAGAMLKFFEWCYEEGNDVAEQLHYVPIPENVVVMIAELWSQKVMANGTAVWAAQ